MSWFQSTRRAKENAYCVAPEIKSGPSKPVFKEILTPNSRFKNPNWPGVDQLTIYKHGQGIELGATVNKCN